MRVLLVSTYDLGRQPFGLASPAAWLRRAGSEVSCADTSRDDMTDEEIARADLVAFYLPMHTATRLAGPVIARVCRVNPGARLAAYGLYAPLNREWLHGLGVQHVIGPEAEADLVMLVKSQISNPKSQIPNPKSQVSNPKSQTRNLESQDPNPELPVPGPETRTPNRESAAPNPSGPDGDAADLRKSIPRLAFVRPDRAGLPALSRYAMLQMPDGTRKVVGSTDATRGCKHLCRHCPIVPVYGGAFRVVPIDVVLQDVRALVEAGAQHISFGDPDFFNGPGHARKVVERVADAFPGVTYDVTIKIEHLLKHADLLPLLRDTGCLFVTSAVESIDDRVLERLRKGHTRAGFIRALDACRRAGVTLSPTFVPFTPWTTLDGYAELLQEIDALDLVAAVAPVQLGIRLLVTAQSALLELPEIHAAIGPFDAGSLTWPWQHADPRVDALQERVMSVVSRLGGAPREVVFEAIRTLPLVPAAPLGRAVAPSPVAARRLALTPYLTEGWYCCAEPGPEQVETL